MKRCEVWWADLAPPAGRRPVLLLSRDAAYSIRSYITVAPLTTHIRQIPVEVPLGPKDGLPKVCVVNLDSIVTISKASLDSFITELTREKVDAVDTAVRFALGLRE